MCTYVYVEQRGSPSMVNYNSQHVLITQHGDESILHFVKLSHQYLSLVRSAHCLISERNGSHILRAAIHTPETWDTLMTAN